MFENIDLKTVSVKSLSHPKEWELFHAILEVRATVLMISSLKALFSPAIRCYPTFLYL